MNQLDHIRFELFPQPQKGDDDEMPVAEGEDDPGRVFEIKCVAGRGTAGEIADAAEFARALKVYPVIRITK